MTFTRAEMFAVLVLIQMCLVGTIIYLVARYRRAWGAGYEAGTIDAGPGAGYATTVAVIPGWPPAPVLELPADAGKLEDEIATLPPVPAENVAPREPGQVHVPDWATDERIDGHLAAIGTDLAGLHEVNPEPEPVPPSEWWLRMEDDRLAWCHKVGIPYEPHAEVGIS